MTGFSNMTCDQCRQAIAVADLTDWGDMDAVATHCHGCESCAAVVTDVRDSARRVAELLDGIPVGVPSALVARRAAAGAAIERERTRRRRRLVYPLVGLVAVVAPVVALFTARIHPGPIVSAPTEVRTVVLNCLGSDQAAMLATPYVEHDGSIDFNPHTEGLRRVTLKGPAHQVREAERAIRAADNPSILQTGESCVLPDPATLAARAMEQDVMRAQLEAEQARQQVEQIRQQTEQARQQAEQARQQAELARQDAARARPDR